MELYFHISLLFQETQATEATQDLLEAVNSDIDRRTTEIEENETYQQGFVGGGRIVALQVVSKLAGWLATFPSWLLVQVPVQVLSYVLYTRLVALLQVTGTSY